MWNEMSYHKFENRDNEIDVANDLSILLCEDYIVSYGLFENLTAQNTFGADDIFSFDCEDN